MSTAEPHMPRPWRRWSYSKRPVVEAPQPVGGGEAERTWGSQKVAVHLLRVEPLL